MFLEVAPVFTGFFSEKVGHGTPKGGPFGNDH